MTKNPAGSATVKLGRAHHLDRGIPRSTAKRARIPEAPCPRFTDHNVFAQLSDQIDEFELTALPRSLPPPACTSEAAPLYLHLP